MSGISVDDTVVQGPTSIERRLRVLFIATRAPYGQMVGHKMGMRTYIRSLQGLGHTVVVAAFAVPGDVVKTEDLNAVTHYLNLPSKATILRNVITKGMRGSLSLNECLYVSADAGQRIAEIIRDEKIDFVVADMIRTACYAEASGLPWIIDHEDLLSDRYEMWASRASGTENILGYLERTIPSFARPTARYTFSKVLRREARVLKRREVYWTQRALGNSLRSMGETEHLRQEAPGRQVFCMPVSVPIPPSKAITIDVRPMLAVFTGGLTYQPNLDALRAYVEQIIPEFQRQGVTLPTLNVIGASPEHLREGLQHPNVRFLGYVPDVNEEVQKAQVFFAPIVSGTGIKTKVLEALACGVPLIALPLGLTGLRGEHGRHYLRAADAADFVTQFKRLSDDLTLARTLGDSGRKLAIEHYSLEAAMVVLNPQIDAALKGL